MTKNPLLEQLPCSVCGKLVSDYAIVGVNEFLGIACNGRGNGCFGWFSGYPWVLFELGVMHTTLVYCLHGKLEWFCDGVL